MDDLWNQERRNRNDAHARQLWQDMEQRVWREARIFSGLSPSPLKSDSTDDIIVLTDEELGDIGELGETGELSEVNPKFPTSLATRQFRHHKRDIN